MQASASCVVMSSSSPAAIAAVSALAALAHHGDRHIGVSSSYQYIGKEAL